MKIKIPICDRCGLSSTRRNMVIGRGQIPCDILFLGEGPGTVEDFTGTPFSGPSGRLLDRLLESAGQRIGCHGVKYYVTNVVLCHPTDEYAGKNRQPKPNEILACQRHIERIISTARPKKILFVGRVAERFYKPHYPDGTYMVHPAALLRSGGKGEPGVIRLLINTIKEVQRGEGHDA